MKRRFLYLMIITAFVCTAALAPAGKVYARSDEIAAVVNEDAISSTDLNKRLKLIMASSGLPNTDDIKKRLIPQVINALIDEQLMLQEAQRLKIGVTQEEINKGFEAIAQQNNMSAEQFKGMLQRGGIDISTLYRQIEAQIAWTKVVQTSLRSQVVISDMDVEDAMARLRAKMGTTEYLAAEIYLPVDDPKKDGQVRNLANRLVQEIKSGKASFFRLAQQFSKAAGAGRGGDVGWLNETQLSEKILDALKKIKKNQVTPPIKTLTGYHIFFLRNTRTMTKETMPSRQQVEYNIGNERLERLQRRRIIDLKASSFVDIRV